MEIANNIGAYRIEISKKKDSVYDRDIIGVKIIKDTFDNMEAYFTISDFNSFVKFLSKSYDIIEDFD